ncbi:bifunctional phosphopantothenoylcysteine decarboxylase/phosphopantothenate--cysteine ligase CoaBC [Desulfovibrio sp. OttesenSCG-928-G15]|nr:bifunctional phosphopantothenoylcysteine decarboxylase/phosphopantothenate--cysteine ligase CoaBC [Desulfovibrio sp. OttesenSCG-928-G15]
MMSIPAIPLLKSRRLHLGVCGSVAAYKAIDLMRLLQKAGISVSVTLTESASRFVTPLSFEALGADPVYTGMFGQDEGLLFGHLQPGRTSDALLIAPATAQTIARLAQGMADDMLSAQALAFKGPVLIAPAMNPSMWANPATKHNISVLQERGYTIIGPGSGVVACGDEGEGKLAPVEEIAFQAAAALCPDDYSDTKILVTLGPTWESWDSVRVWTNRSTGRMGSALASVAALRGATVYAVAGPVSVPLPASVHCKKVQSAEEMFSAASSIWETCTHGIFTAAVADFKPVPHTGGKFKKHGNLDGFSISLLPNPDILATLSARKDKQKILGFAAETKDIEEAVQSKLLAKHADLLAGNIVGQQEGGFGDANNSMYVLDRNGKNAHWPLLPKEEVAWRLLDWLLTL